MIDNFKFLKLLRFSLAVLMLCCFHVFLSAQDSTAHNKYIAVKQDKKISELLYKYRDYNRKKEFADGYRIQIMFTDVRDEVYKNKGQMYHEFPDMASYVEYEQPYYKLRLGDFKTRLEATNALQQIVVLYSGAFIVKDKIKIKQ
ncbi:MAG: Sporulation domain protein [Bacteroidota bacterium]|nr:Sporulation domain protein [Bacteroidota bacterium]